MSVKMTRYKHAEFADDDVSSIGSVQLTGGVTSSTTHIRYHTGSSMWRRRSMLEKALLLLVGTLLFVIFVLIILLSVNSSRDKVLHIEVPHSPCLSETCIHAASDMLQAMDHSVDPCEDFYSYSCNGWIKNNPLPDGKSMWGTFGKLEQQNQLIIKHVLEKPIDELKSKAEQKAKIYYESCLDVNETIEALGAAPMLKLLKDVGGWNVSDSGFNITNWSLQNTLQILQNKYNMGGLFSWAVGEDDKNSSRHIIQIDQSGLTLPTRDNYLNKTAHAKVLSAYLDYMTKVGVLLGGEENTTKLQMQAVIDFETRLAEITTPTEDRRDEEALYHLMPLSELQVKAGFMKWRQYFEDALRLVNRKVTSKENVVVYAPEYLTKLTHLLSEYNATDEKKIVVNNYLIWQMVRSLTACLSKAFRDAYKGLRKALIGSEGGEEPWRYCITDTNNMIGFAIGAMFVREVFHGDSKQQAEAMINEVREAFKRNLKNLKWMDTETRNAAIIKADAISDMIGFPDFILNPVQLDKKYDKLEVRDDEYFMNNIRLSKYNLKKNLEKLDEPVNKTRWSMTPPTVNAYYTPTKNQMVFPAGILQSPFYEPRYPPSLNYGAMGVVMGHELTHAFDDQGREYDKEGNLHQWWNNKTIDRFKNRTQCVDKQYSNYKIKTRSLNGKQTLGENIADNGGLKAAYHAFLEVSQRSPSPAPLPGLNLTHRQLFFVSFAQVWCSTVTDEATNLQIEKDPHSPPMFRVIGSLSNLKEFADEFQCKPATRMNPRKKCEVW
ncbi:Neprilysin 3 [Carabus blaptoides fortunei]